MKKEKVYCFHCQKEIKPFRILNWQFCPHCFHKTEDKGEGFYLVCDKCGANIPVNSTHCLKCGHGVNGHSNYDVEILSQPNQWLVWLIRIALIALSIIVSIGIIYISFYLIFIFLVLGLAFFIVNMFSQR